MIKRVIIKKLTKNLKKTDKIIYFYQKNVDNSKVIWYI